MSFGEAERSASTVFGQICWIYLAFFCLVNIYTGPVQTASSGAIFALSLNTKTVSLQILISHEHTKCNTSRRFAEFQFGRN